MSSKEGYKRNIDTILADSRISKANREVLKKYDTYGNLQQLTLGTRSQRLGTLRQVALFINKDFKAMTKEDMENFFVSLGELQPKTWSTKGAFIKSFFKWLYNSDVYPANVRWIKTSVKSKDNKLPTDLLTKEEITSMVDAADNLRDRALVLMLYESACRIGEISTLKLKDIIFDEYGAVIVVNGKTGMRRVRLIDYVPDIENWVNNHPWKHDREAYLFISLSNSNFGKRINGAGLGKNIKDLAKKAGIEKRVHPHLFRHTRLTELAKDFTESELKIIAGWSGSSKMAGVYVHLSGGDIEKKMLQKHGLIKNENTALEPCTHISYAEVMENKDDISHRTADPIVMDPNALQFVISGVVQEVMKNLFTMDNPPLNDKKRIQDSVKISCQ